MAPLQTRLDLQALLEDVLGTDYKVYFQPPNNLTLTYPCVRYQRDDAHVDFGDNFPYRRMWRYQVMVITRKPDDPAVEIIANLPLCHFEQHYVAENLNHDVFNIFF
jgi:hypothetical protein